MPSSSAHCVTGSTTSAQRRGLGQDDVGDDEQVERRRAASATWVRVGRGDDELEPSTSSAAGPPSVPSASSSSNADRPGPGSVVRVDAPDPGDVRAGGRVVDHPVAGQLVGLLAVLAAALAVALAGEAAVAGERPAGQAERQGEVDPGQHGVGALARAARRRGRSGPSPGRRPASRRAERRAARRPATPVTRSTRSGHQRGDRAAHGVEAGGARGDVRLVDVRRRRRRMCSRPIASARSVPGSGCRCRSARSAVGVRRGSTTTTVPPRSRSAVEVLHRRRHGLGEVGADQQEHVGLAEVGQRERQPAVEAERPVAGGRGRATCRSGRCSRSGWCPARPGRTCRAGRPSRWSARRRRRRRPRRGRAPPAAARSRRRPGRAPRPTTAGRSSPVARSRTSGVVSRSRWSSSSAAVQPFWHSPPRLTGNSAHGRDLRRVRRPATRRHPALQRAVRAVGLVAGSSDRRRRPGSATRPAPDARQVDRTR